MKKPRVRGDEERNRLVEQWRGLPFRAATYWMRKKRWLLSYGRDDAVSDAFRGLMRAAELWQDGVRSRGRTVQFQTYAFRYCWGYVARGYSQALGRERREERQEIQPVAEAVSRLPGPAEEAARRDRRRFLFRQLRLLPPKQGLAVALYCLRGRTQEEAGRVMRVSDTRVGQLVEKGLGGLRRRMRREKGGGACP